MDELGMSETEIKRFNTWVNGSGAPSSNRIFYEQNDYTKTINSLGAGVYNGTTRLGRMFARTKTGAPVYRSQGLKKIVRNTLYYNTHYDIDIANCHPVIASQLFGHLDIPFLKEYAASRESILDLCKNPGLFVDGVRGAAQSVPESMVKKMVAGILNNAGKTFGLFGSDLQYATAAAQIPFFSGLVKERELIYEDIRSTYAGFYALAKKLADDSNSSNVNGKAFSILIQDVENEMMRTIVNKLEGVFKKQAFDNIVLMFDGLMVPRSMVDDMESFTEMLEEEIERKMGFRVKLKSKPLDPFFDDCVNIDDAIIDVDAALNYPAWKNEFEKTHYRVELPSCYVRVYRGGASYHNLSRFKNEVCAEENDDFVKEWIKDKNKRKYEKENFYPPPAVCPPDEMNTFRGLRAESLPPVPEEDVEDLVSFVLRHVAILCGGRRSVGDYVLNWLARKVQMPGVLPGVGLGFRSVEGTGKDSFFSFFGNKILGSEYYTQAPEMSSIFADKHSTATKDKLLVVISECTRGDSNSVRQKVKSFMTAPTVKFRPLYVDDMVRSNYCGVVMFGQDQQFLNLEGDDRRFVVVDALPIHANDPVYFSKLIPMFEDDRVARAFYQYLMERDITGFKISADRPMTMARENMTMFSAKPFYVFLLDYIAKQDALVNPPGAVVPKLTFHVPRSEMCAEYADFVQINYPKYADDIGQKRKAISEIKTLSNDSIIKDEDDRIYYPFKQVIVRGVQKVKIDTEKMILFLKKYVPDDFNLDVPTEEVLL
jgi:hypothetical protein